MLAFPSNQFGNQEPNVNKLNKISNFFLFYFFKNDAFIQSWAKDMFDINFPIFGKGAVIKEGNENEDELPDIWKYLSGKLI